MIYLHAANELKTLIDEIDWTGVLADEPAVVLRAYDYQAVVNRDSSTGSVTTTSPDPIDQGKTNFITLSRLPSGEEINTMEGFTGISKQYIRICCFSIRRSQVSLMGTAVHNKINNYSGRPKRGTSTTLSAEVTTGPRVTISVASSSGFLVGESVTLDDEDVTVVEIESSTKMKVDRVPDGNTYATIASGSNVKSLAGAEIQSCLLEDVGDLFEEESGYYGLDMYFMATVSY